METLMAFGFVGVPILVATWIVIRWRRDVARLKTEMNYINEGYVPISHPQGRSYSAGGYTLIKHSGESYSDDECSPMFHSSCNPCAESSFPDSSFSDSGCSDSLFSDSSPSVNIDGSPMCGGIDVHGNPYGVTSHDD